MKIVFITYHNWRTKRHGGFHALAEHACRAGHEVLFFSFSRPYYSYFMKDERLNASLMRSLTEGEKTKVGTNYVTNITWPTFSLKGRLRRFTPNWLNTWLDTHSIHSFKTFSEKWLNNTDCFVLESNESILLYDYIKKYYPTAKITYRPSDPIVDYRPSAFPRLVSKEIELMPKFDMSFIVNEEGVQLYRNNVKDFDKRCKWNILVNGIYIDDYKKVYPRPLNMKEGKSVLYLGVEPIEWELVIKAATQLKEATFYIIIPMEIDSELRNRISQIPNLIFIPGVYHEEVPAWITNADVIITPLLTGFQNRRKSFHISAKNLKPIAANKPIVTYCNNPILSEYGITTTYTYDDFINEVEKSLNEERREYKIDLDYYNWNTIGNKFLKILEDYDQK